MPSNAEKQAPNCPCCGNVALNTDPAENARSRFTLLYICNRCGITEALQGDVWKAKRDNSFITFRGEQRAFFAGKFAL